jgi:hypothetical protein
LCGATQQTFPYPGTAHRFDPMIFHGDTTEFDINEAEKQLLSLVKCPPPLMDVTYLSYNGTTMELATGNLLWISFALMVKNAKCQR